MPRPSKPARTPSPKRRPKAPPRSGPLDRTTVVELAVRVLEDDGIDQLSLVRVATRLGVTQPARYRHVGSFDELLRLLALAGRRQLLDAITNAAIGRAGDDALHAVATAWRAFAMQHPGLYAA